jgi:prepilin-type N-terminal cleavage/methylation domain-containing protein
MYRSYQTRNSRGFSLLEVLIAVVVLATGLLALATLQANLARSSAEAKVRGRVAAMLSARMDQLRSAGFDSATLDSGAFTTNTAETCATSASPWLCNAGKEAGLGALTVNQTVQVWSGTIGGNTFNNAAPADPLNDPQFKRVLLAANWADSAGSNHVVSMTSDISPLALRSSLVPPPDPNSSSNTKPVVREDDPTETGMIPIAIGNGSQSAATNPKPVVVGKNNTLIETKYNVLTYQSSGGAAQVQQRVETTVIGCHCKYGNQSALTGIYSQNFRPTYWNGTQYQAPKLLDVSDSAQRPVAGPVGAGSTDKNEPQSDLCTDCCRDHHDASTDTVKFDPFRTDGHNHYRNTNLSAVVNPNSGGDYNESCRVIRVDGFWRVATDARIVHFDYIGTGPAVTDQAPDPTYAGYYKTFVVDYLRNRFVGPDDGLSADARYALAPAKHPASITIVAGDKRYQHTHAVLVDNIETEAQNKINSVLANCTKTDKADCVLPYVPFTTINLTELAHYVASDDKVIGVLDGGTNFNDPAVIQGQVVGLSTAPQGTNTVTADATIKLSNTGLSGILAIDPQDATTLPTAPPPAATWVPGKQTYSLTNGTPTTGDNFMVSLSPAFATMNNGTFLDDPGVRWGSGLTPCAASSTTTTNPYKCHNTAGFGGASTTVTVSGYNGYQAGVGTDVPVAQRSITCTEDKNNNPGTQPYVLTSTDPVNICKNYQVLADAAYTLGSVTSPGQQAEQTTVTFPSVNGGDSGTIKFGAEADSYSYTCTYRQTGNNNNVTYTFTVVAAACP